ncbi:Ig-like domain-containing protein [Desulfofustis glycolicus]|nr:Ig-like domain-containing protein [Desulfofustis glycolicus]MCB2215226.1 DUF4347 domain-containing protein [Desulfobulbaceae bacterium]
MVEIQTQADAWRKTDARRRATLIRALEPRMMFDAAAVGTAVEVQAQAQPEVAPEPVEVEAPAPAPAPAPVAADTESDPDADVADEAALQAEPIDQSPEPATAETEQSETDPIVDNESALDVTASESEPSSTLASELPESLTTAVPGQEVVFVLDNLPDVETLTGGMREGVEMVMLDAQGDGLAQMADHLQGRTGLSAIHVISHGDEGRVSLGSTWLDAQGVTEREGLLQQIGQSLTEEGDILLYGCYVGANGQGVDFITALAASTGADVAASTDNTGSAAMGGNWVLEATQGSIETASLHLSNYSDLLVAFSDDFSTNTGSAITNFTRTLGGVSYTFTFTSDGDGGDFAWENANGFGGSASVNMLSGVDTGAIERVTIARTDGADFSFDSIYINNTGGGTTNVRGYLDGIVTGANQTMAVGASGTLSFGSLHVDQVQIISTNFLFTNFDNFAGDTNPPNTAPTITNLNGDTVAWAGVGNTVTLDSGGNASVTDAELGALNGGNGDWSGASLTVQRNTAVGADTFGFNTSGALFTVSGANLQSGGQTFASFANTGGVLTVNFSSSDTTATTALVNDVARHITYQNNTPAGDASIRFTLHDGTVAGPVANVNVTSDTIYVTNTTDTATINVSNGVSFSEAVAIAAADATGSQTLVFSNGFNNSMTLAGALAINESLTINGDAANDLIFTGSNITLGDGTTLNFSNSTGAVTIASALAGAGSLTKAGAGTLTLSASNTYSGTTNVNAGTLLVNGTLSATSNITVASAATLGGIGSVSSNVTVNSGGTLSPGNSGAGALALNGDLTMASGSTLAVEINGTSAGTQYDQVIVNGAVDVSGATLSVTHGYTPGSGDSYTIIVNDATDAVTGAFTGIAEGASFAAGGNSTQLTASYVGGTGNDFTLTAPNNPTVTSVSSISADGTYKIGDTVTVVVNFSEAVFLSTGTLQLTLETGTTDRVLSYLAGSGSATLYFSYTVQAGDTAADLDYTNTTALAANGDTIQSGSFIDANLTLPTPGAAGSLGANQDIVIDGVRPTASIVVSDTALAVGETSTVTITFNEAVTGLAIADFTVANGVLSGLSTGDGGITWTATLTPTAGTTDTSNLISLDNTGVADAAGNTGTGTTDSNNYAIDTLRPTATIVVADTALAVGETSTVTITFNEAVSGLALGDFAVANGALSGLSSSDGGITWTATLTPTAGIADTSNLITLDNTGVADAAGNTGTGTTDSNNYIIDGLPPSVASVTVPANGTYGAGQNLDFTVNFSETVVVDTSGGTPRVAVTLDTGGTVYAEYVSGSGSTALLFRLTVTNGLQDDNGITLASSIEPNGGTLLDAVGNSAQTALNGVGSTSGVLVAAASEPAPVPAPDPALPTPAPVSPVPTPAPVGPVPTRPSIPSASQPLPMTPLPVGGGFTLPAFAPTPLIVSGSLNAWAGSSGATASSLSGLMPVGISAVLGPMNLDEMSGAGWDRDDQPWSVPFQATDLAGAASMGIPVMGGQDAVLLRSGQPFEYTVPLGALMGDDLLRQFSMLIEVRQVDGSPLPAWLRFDPVTGKFSGVPPVGFSGTLRLELSVQDAQGERRTLMLEFEVQAGRADQRGDAGQESAHPLPSAQWLSLHSQWASHGRGALESQAHALVTALRTPVSPA